LTYLYFDVQNDIVAIRW